MNYSNEEIEILANEMEGNWTNWSFAWFKQPENAERYTIYNFYCRNVSTLVDDSNARVFRAITKTERLWIENHSCSMTGGVQAIVCLVRDDKGSVTEEFKQLAELILAIGEYPILDDDHYSDLVWDTTYSNILEELKKVAPKFDGQLEEKFFDYIRENDLWPENIDDQGGYLDEDEIIEILKELST